MEESMRTLHEFENENRKAVVTWEEGILYVALYENADLIKTVNCMGHTEQYAENAAENWVMKWGKFE